MKWLVAGAGAVTASVMWLTSLVRHKKHLRYHLPCGASEAIDAFVQQHLSTCSECIKILARSQGTKEKE